MSGTESFSFRTRRIPFTVGAQRKIVRNARRFDSRDRADASDDLLEDLPSLDLAPSVSGAVVVVDPNRSGSVRLEPQVNIQHFHKASQQQPALTNNTEANAISEITSAARTRSCSDPILRPYPSP